MSGKSVGLISSSAIKQEDFLSFVQSLGAVIIGENPYYHIVISRGDIYVSIALDNAGFSQYEASETEVFTQILTAKPQTYVFLDIGKELGSEQLAIEIACAFAERWPCIVDSGRVYSNQELFELRNSGGDFEDE